MIHFEQDEVSKYYFDHQLSQFISRSSTKKVIASIVLNLLCLFVLLVLGII